MDIVLLVGRILFALIFIASGFAHFAQAEAMAGYAKMKGAPGGKAGVLLSGVMILAGGISVAAGIYGDLGALLLALFLIPSAVLMHAFWKEEDPMAKQTENVMFMKNISMAGAALVLIYLFSQVDVPLTVTKGLFS